VAKLHTGDKPWIHAWSLRLRKLQKQIHRICDRSGQFPLRIQASRQHIDNIPGLDPPNGRQSVNSSVMRSKTRYEAAAMDGGGSIFFAIRGCSKTSVLEQVQKIKDKR
jgi:hypothetical protein